MVSIHTPTQGVTILICPTYIYPFSFNPHTHAGCDPLDRFFILLALVSIHTPTQGVTYEPEYLEKLLGVSIHTPTQGVTGK